MTTLNIRESGTAKGSIWVMARVRQEGTARPLLTSIEQRKVSQNKVDHLAENQAVFAVTLEDEDDKFETAGTEVDVVAGPKETLEKLQAALSGGGGWKQVPWAESKIGPDDLRDLEYTECPLSDVIADWGYSGETPEKVLQEQPNVEVKEVPQDDAAPTEAQPNNEGDQKEDAEEVASTRKKRGRRGRNFRNDGEDEEEVQGSSQAEAMPHLVECLLDWVRAGQDRTSMRDILLQLRYSGHPRWESQLVFRDTDLTEALLRGYITLFAPLHPEKPLGQESWDPNSICKIFVKEPIPTPNGTPVIRTVPADDVDYLEMVLKHHLQGKEDKLLSFSTVHGIMSQASPRWREQEARNMLIQTAKKARILNAQCRSGKTEVKFTPRTRNCNKMSTEEEKNAEEKIERTHPCLRVYGTCRNGDDCMWASFPWDACMKLLETGTCPEHNAEFPTSKDDGRTRKTTTSTRDFTNPEQHGVAISRYTPAFMRTHPCKYDPAGCAAEKEGKDPCPWIKFPAFACLDFLQGTCSDDCPLHILQRHTEQFRGSRPVQRHLINQGEHQKEGGASSAAGGGLKVEWAKTKQPPPQDQMQPQPQQPATQTQTKICFAFRSGQCNKGGSCNYAHGEAELRPAAVVMPKDHIGHFQSTSGHAPLPSLSKTKICFAFRRSGHCDKGGSCIYAHSDAELRSAAAPETKRTSRSKLWAEGDVQPSTDQVKERKPQPPLQSQAQPPLAPPSQARLKTHQQQPNNNNHLLQLHKYQYAIKLGQAEFADQFGAWFGPGQEAQLSQAVDASSSSQASRVGTLPMQVQRALSGDKGCIPEPSAKVSALIDF